MYTARPLLAFVLALTVTAPALAQCPDGTPPPCRAAAATAGPRGPIDENLIAIFPFRITGTSQDAASLREGAMDLLGLALDEQAGLRVVPSRTLLARARSFTDATSVADAAALARSLGAGTMILGNAVVVGTQVRARAEMHDLVRGRPIASAEARGASSDPAPIIDSLAAALARVRLTSGAGTTRRALHEFATTSPTALGAYLAGERLARHGRWQEAADSLQRAIAADSTFGLAYYRLRIASTFGAQVGSRTAAELISTALRFADRLPRRQRDVLDAVAAMYAGTGPEAFRLADVLGERYPDDVEAAYEEGEAYYHLGLQLGETASRALAPYDRAIRLDSSFIDPYNHAAELRIMLGDTTGAMMLGRRALELAPMSGVHLALGLALRAVHGDQPSALAQDYWAHHAGVVDGTNVVHRAGQEAWRMLTNDPGRAVRVADAFYVVAGQPDRPRSERLAPRLNRIITLTALGRFDAAREALAEAQQLDPGRTSLAADAAMLALLSGGRDLAERAADLRRVAPATVTQLGLIGWCAVELRDTILLDSVVRQVGAGTGESALRGAVTQGLRGLDALRRGDTAAARAQFSAAYGILPYSASALFQAQLALELARLERAAGHLDAANAPLSMGAFTNAIIPQRAEMEELRAQIAEQRGDTTAAIRSWRNFVSLWQDADPGLQPRVTAARAAVARLERR
jgi:tetratricopeptide (TPR) repeat protein